jgi:hypothetical protein
MLKVSISFIVNLYIHAAAMSKNCMIHAVSSKPQLTESNRRYLPVASIKRQKQCFHVQFDTWKETADIQNCITPFQKYLQYHPLHYFTMKQLHVST